MTTSILFSPLVPPDAPGPGLKPSSWQPTTGPMRRSPSRRATPIVRASMPNLIDLGNQEAGNVGICGTLQWSAPML